MNKELIGKFFKGAFTGGVAAGTAFFASKCGIPLDKEFISALALAVGSGAFHAAWNYAFPPTTLRIK